MRQDRILIIIFCTLLAIPLLLQVAGVTVGETIDENRVRANFPSLIFPKTKKAPTAFKKVKASYKDVVKIQEGFESYVNDNFVLKPILFDGYAAIQTGLFNENPKPEKVVEGAEGWSFLGNLYSNVILESKGLQSFSSENLDQLEQSLRNKKQWLAENNIDFYIAIAPNKHSVYGEYLPIKKGQKETKTNQLKEIAKASGVKFIDLTPTLLQHKNEAVLYHKRNSHWNDIGAYLAADSLLKFINQAHPQVQLLNIENYKKVAAEPMSNDLDKLLRKKTTSKAYTYKTEQPNARAIEAPVEVPANYYAKPENYVFSFESDVNGLSILVFRDSFSTAMLPYFKEGFGKSHFIWDHKFDKALIKKLQPDIVLYEIAERDIDKFPLK